MSVRIRFLPDDKSAQVRPGTTVLQAAAKARVHIRTRCGGKAACLMCKVKLEQGELAPPAANEALKLGELAEEGFRLACQAKLTGPCTIAVPEDPLKAAVRRRLEEQQQDDGSI